MHVKKGMELLNDQLVRNNEIIGKRTDMSSFCFPFGTNFGILFRLRVKGLAGGMSHIAVPGVYYFY